MDVTAIIVAASIPSALTGFFFWLIEQSRSVPTRKKQSGKNGRRK